MSEQPCHCGEQECLGPDRLREGWRCKANAKAQQRITALEWERDSAIRQFQSAERDAQEMLAAQHAAEQERDDLRAENKRFRDDRRAHDPHDYESAWQEVTEELAEAKCALAAALVPDLRPWVQHKAEFLGDDITCSVWWFETSGESWHVSDARKCNCGLHVALDRHRSGV